jgi:hypothetical protein
MSHFFSHECGCRPCMNIWMHGKHFFSYESNMADGVAKSINFAISTVFARLACCNCVHYSKKTFALILKAILYLLEYLYVGSNLYSTVRISRRRPMSEQLNMRNDEWHEFSVYSPAQSEITTCVCVYFNVLFLKIHHLLMPFTRALTSRRWRWPTVNIKNKSLRVDRRDLLATLTD